MQTGPTVGCAELDALCASVVQRNAPALDGLPLVRRSVVLAAGDQGRFGGRVGGALARRPSPFGVGSTDGGP
jgi:hypothetical protein